MGNVAVSYKNITKTFGEVIANHDVSLDINKGEILAILGENGSGKTTLMNMLAGIYRQDSGEILIDGKAVNILSPRDAFDYKIGMVHQHFKLVDVFTAAENLVLGVDGKAKLSRKEIADNMKEICDTYGFELDPNQKVYDMSVSQKQTLEIVKVLYRGVDVLILDEPTAVLTPQETDKLFAVIRNMKKHGKSVVIITHKLHEVLAISDRVAILRKGEYIGSVDTVAATQESLTEMMVGKKVELNITRNAPKDPKKRMSIQNLTCINKEGVQVLTDVSIDVFGGEILGIAGISGNGQKELLEAIAGLQKIENGGKILYYDPKYENEIPLRDLDPRDIRKLGVSLSFVPEDRLGMGLVGSMGMTENMMLHDYADGKSFFVSKKKPQELAQEVKDKLEIVTPSINTPVRRLSGGNVQKVLVGREIAAQPTVMMTAYAVRGLDINTSYTIYDLLNKQKESGVAVIYVGEDLDVLLELCDRILVLCSGQVNGILDGRSATKEQVGLLMTSLVKKEESHE